MHIFFYTSCIFTIKTGSVVNAWCHTSNYLHKECHRTNHLTENLPAGMFPPTEAQISWISLSIISYNSGGGQRRSTRERHRRANERIKGSVTLLSSSSSPSTRSTGKSSRRRWPSRSVPCQHRLPTALVELWSHSHLRRFRVAWTHLQRARRRPAARPTVSRTALKDRKSVV